MSDIADMYRGLVSQYQVLEGRLKEKQTIVQTISDEVNVLQDKVDLYNQSLDVLEAAQQLFQTKVFDKMDTLLTDALQVICNDENIEIKTVIEHRRGQPEVVFTYRDGVSPEFGDLLYTHGGGIADIVSCGLRLILAELLSINGFIILDEPARMLHSQNTQHEQNFITFLQEFSHRRGRQIIIITHSDHLACIGDKSFRVFKDANRNSKVEVNNG